MTTTKLHSRDSELKTLETTVLGLLRSVTVKLKVGLLLLALRSRSFSIAVVLGAELQTAIARELLRSPTTSTELTEAGMRGGGAGVSLT
jgi:hypothetical protein